MALICETVMASSVDDLREVRDRSAADMVELRLDAVAGLDVTRVASALEGRRRPAIVTCRARWEGGHFQGSERERLGILAAGLAAGAEYVDVEWQAGRQALGTIDAARIVVSHHDFAGVPVDLEDRVRAMRAASPQGIVKIAVTVERPSDLVRLRDLAHRDPGRHIVIGMGPAGTLSRACPDRFGSPWTYSGTAAPGQLSAAELRDVYRVRSQSETTRLFALTGSPLAHSASPAMHNAAFAAIGLDAVYVPIETTDAEEFLGVAQAFGVEGASVTAPLKTSWDRLGVVLNDVASAVGAVNTLTRGPAGWTAQNFDIDGFVAPLHARGIQLRGARCVVLGAGGAARAAAWALSREGACVEVSSRRADRAEALATALNVSAAPWPPAPDWDLLVNATPVGTWPASDVSPLSRSSVRGRVVYDLVYHPRETTLLAWARQAGAAVISGLDMLVTQAARQFEHWTRRPAPVSAMQRAAEQFLRGADR